MGNAALSAISANTIQGSRPYLTFDNGVTKVTNTDELLGITLSNGTQYSKSNNPSSESSPIQLANNGDTFSNVKTLVPTAVNTIDLAGLISSPYNYWGDDDDGDGNGNGNGVNGITASGSLSLVITDVEGNSVSRTEAISICNSPYKMVLTATDGSLSTKYGIPNETLFNEASVTYYISPKIDTPYACWAQPNLQYTDTGYYDPTYEYWNTTKGFKLYSLGVPSSNFPTTGFNKAYFNLTIENGALWSDVEYDKSPSSSGIDLVITGTDNVAKIELTGPLYASTPSVAATAVPTTFTLYSDTAKTNAIYTFTINKWFVAKARVTGGYTIAKNYCSSLGYRIPSITEYTNGNGNGNGWTGGLFGQGNTYQRRIAGGLFAEWGNSTKSYYTGNEIEGSEYYWASNTNGTTQPNIGPEKGLIGYTLPSFSPRGVMCVNP